MQRLPLPLVVLICAACASDRAATMSFTEAGIAIEERIEAPPSEKPPVRNPRKARKHAAPRRVVKVVERRVPPAVWPVDPVFITSPFGWRMHPVTGRGAP